jgi:LuxR family transcriptional regulator, maltose regulon positive regulatory protein
MAKNSPEHLSIIRAKLHAPRIPSDLVCRGRLYELLDQNPSRPFTLVSAPAGYGKSTLVANWLRKANVASAWFSIEESDNDVRQFLTYLIAAVRTHSRNACGTTLRSLRAPELPTLAALRDQLNNDLDAIRKPLRLVLDDFHHIDRMEVHEIINHLLDFPPRSLHLVVVTRHDPPVKLNKLRADGLMVDVRERDLRFTEAETRTVLQRVAGVEVSDALLTHIHSELDGWIVGLRLVCLALQNHTDPESFLRNLSRGIPMIQDYLAGEVLAHQPDTFRHRLLSVAILDRFCAPLCDAVCKLGGGRDGGAPFVSQLMKANLFTIELDNKGEWFRFHHLFQRLLLNQLELKATGDEIAALHLRASIWLESQGMVEESLKHAMAADDAKRAACLLKQFREKALKTDRWYVVLKWLALLPEDTLLQHPELLLIRAWMFAHQYQYPRVIQVLDRIEALMPGSDELQDLSGEIASLRGMALQRLGDSRGGLKYLKSALSLTPESSLEKRAQVEVNFCLASQQDGKKDEAIQFLDGMMNKNPAPQGVRKSRLDQVYVFLHIISGHLTQAERANQPIGALTDDVNVYGEAFREYLQGLIHLYRYEPEAALESLAYFRRTTSRRSIQFRRAAIDSMTCLTLSCRLLGRDGEAENALQLLREFVSGTGDSRLSILVDSAVARMDALRGCTDASMRWAETARFPFDTTLMWFLDIPWITACRVRITEGSAAGLKRAEEELHKLLKLNESHHNDIKLTEILCLLAVACYLQGDTEGAREHLGRALTLARRGGVVLPFVEWSPSLAKVMLEMLPQNSDWLITRIRHILSDHPAADRAPQPAVDALTNREFEVLELLAKRLYDKEIAVELGISTETVKTHVKRIREKLGVVNRRQAVAKALELGLLRNRGNI